MSIEEIQDHDGYLFMTFGLMLKSVRIAGSMGFRKVETYDGTKGKSSDIIQKPNDRGLKND